MLDGRGGASPPLKRLTDASTTRGEGILKRAAGRGGAAGADRNDARSGFRLPRRPPPGPSGPGRPTGDRPRQRRRGWRRRRRRRCCAEIIPPERRHQNAASIAAGGLRKSPGRAAAAVLLRCTHPPPRPPCSPQAGHAAPPALLKRDTDNRPTQTSFAEARRGTCPGHVHAACARSGGDVDSMCSAPAAPPAARPALLKSDSASRPDPATAETRSKSEAPPAAT